MFSSKSYIVLVLNCVSFFPFLVDILYMESSKGPTSFSFPYGCPVVPVPYLTSLSDLGILVENQLDIECGFISELLIVFH